MAKGYWISRVDVADPEKYKEYVAANAVAFKKYGARFIVPGGKFESPEGSSRARNVSIKRRSKYGSQSRPVMLSSLRAVTVRSPRKPSY